MKVYKYLNCYNKYIIYIFKYLMTTMNKIILTQCYAVTKLSFFNTNGISDSSLWLILNIGSDVTDIHNSEFIHQPDLEVSPIYFNHFKKLL